MTDDEFDAFVVYMREETRERQRAARKAKKR
jgi:hypothetical protein